MRYPVLRERVTLHLAESALQVVPEHAMLHFLRYGKGGTPQCSIKPDALSQVLTALPLRHLARAGHRRDDNYRGSPATIPTTAGLCTHDRL